MTYEEALNKLPFPYNEMAKKNYKNDPYTGKADSVKTTYFALATGFYWEKYEGEDFWKAIHDNCVHENI